MMVRNNCVLLLAAAVPLLADSASARSKGSLLWKRTNGGPGTSGDLIDNAPAAVDSNGVYFVSEAEDWGVFALDLKTGEQLWNATHEAAASASSPTVLDGSLFYLLDNGKVQLHSHHAESGKKNWVCDLPSASVNDAPVAGGNGFVYVMLGSSETDQTNTLHAVDASTGKISWSTFVDGTPSRPVVANGRLFVSAFDNQQQESSKHSEWSSTTVHAFNAHSGARLWSSANVGNQWATPVVVDGKVLTSAESSSFFALDAATGDRLWEATVDGYNGLAPAVEDGRAFLAGALTSMYAFNVSTGDILWSTDLVDNGHLWSVPSVADGSVYVGGDDGNLHSLDAATGKVQWKYEVDPSLAVGSPVVNDGVVYVGANTPWGVGSPDQLFAVSIEEGRSK